MQKPEKPYNNVRAIITEISNNDGTIYQAENIR
jgi:hypothetical protein